MSSSSQPLVSIIMPAYNAEPFIGQAIASVIAQTHSHWELIIVDDGSTDRTGALIDAFVDVRIIRYHKPNGGIGSARNMGLAAARGEYLCFLDADDMLPPRSIASRVELLEADPGLGIADGRVLYVNGTMDRVLRTFEPRPVDDPFAEMVTFSGRCFMGLSWMFRRSHCVDLRFEERISHAEDLFYCMNYAHDQRYAFTQEEVLHYRRTGNTSMHTNLDGMDRSMRWIGRQLLRSGRTSWKQWLIYSLKRRRMMAGSFWKAGRRWRALLALLY
ncbi:MAG: hypothetical protein GFGODING_03066 [Flavobacteriales bacterium]|nr:hypothetical protein [Flavobacteriales bacterium]